MTIDLDTLLLTDARKPITPGWLRKASQNIGYCGHCHSQYGKAELNAQKHCRHCADELNETHPMNANITLEPASVTLARQLAEAEQRTLYCLEQHGADSAAYRDALLIEMALRRAQMRLEAEGGR